MALTIYRNLDNGGLRYITYADARNNKVPLIADPNDPNSHAFYTISPDESGIFKINGQEIDPNNTYLPIDQYGRILNNLGSHVIQNGTRMTSDNEGYVYMPHLGGWVRVGQPSYLNQGETDANLQEEKRRQALADMSNAIIAGSPGMNYQYMTNNPNAPYEIVPEGLATGTAAALLGPGATAVESSTLPYLMLGATALGTAGEASAKVHSLDYWKNIINSRTAEQNVARVKEIEKIMADKYGLIWNGTDFVNGEEKSSETSPLPYLLGADAIKGAASYYLDHRKNLKLGKLGKFGKGLVKYAPLFTGSYYLYDWATGEPDELRDLRNEYAALIANYKPSDYSTQDQVSYQNNGGAKVDSASNTGQFQPTQQTAQSGQTF